MEVAGVLLVPTPINHLEHSSPLHNRFRVYGPRIKCVIAKTFSKKKKKKSSCPGGFWQVEHQIPESQVFTCDKVIDNSGGDRVSNTFSFVLKSAQLLKISVDSVGVIKTIDSWLRGENGRIHVTSFGCCHSRAFCFV